MKALLVALLALFSGSAFGQTTGACTNSSGILLASAARTAATTTSPDIVNSNYAGIHLIMNTSAYTSGNFTPTIQGKDPISGTYYSILVGAAVSATGIQIIKVYPGIATAANGAASDFMPRIWRVSVAGASSPVATFSISYFSEC